jgi:hypothetical protein
LLPVLRRIVIVAALCVPLGAAGCSATGATSSTKFSGPQGDVAKVVSDLSTAGQRKDAQKICTQILSQALVRQLDAVGTSCQQEMKKAIDDADGFDLAVTDVTVNGSQATAKVKGTNRGKDVIRTFSFVKEDGGWRISAFG